MEQNLEDCIVGLMMIKARIELMEGIWDRSGWLIMEVEEDVVGLASMMSQRSDLM
jgi:hypothetical protein